ncbi:MAG TPA: hypothetical protein VME44_28200 [Streptosporangiaceae bacterium]|nr:hypothetical protein [Streptosporangiaceae bacterium]
MIDGVSRTPSRPAGTASTLLALGLAIVAAVAGAVLWGLAALVIHRQLSLIGLLIGLGAGSAVARFRPGHRPTVVAGAVIAVAGCALGTFLAIVFTLLDQQVSVSTIISNLNVILHSYPSAVGGLGLLFWLIAAYAAVRVPLRSQRAAGLPAKAPGQAAATQPLTWQVPGAQASDGDPAADASGADASGADAPAASNPAREVPEADGTAPATLAPMTDTAPGADGEQDADAAPTGGYGTAADPAS